ncbi:PAS domain S-box protein [Dolichospermum heterosporum]|uniref:histidine kinase n=1 Tax=Dolichospermum heterosporum TAC447 TaxID=747523 RepID=A0ABY5LRY7_9CYAN|nr:PAS domain S-box protein [Dolichospermum heterosporum]UUO13502.1 PAS domain S-box protein [Dolichospermum heterosporum TAC447]
MKLVTELSIDQTKPLNPLVDGLNEKLIDLPSLHQIIDYSPVTIGHDGYVMDAIKLMNQVAVSHLTPEAKDYVLVVEGKKLQGILTINDVLKVVASNTNLSAVKMADVMNQSPITLKESDSEHILTVLALLQQHGIQQLPIVDDEDNLIGIVHEKDLLQSLNIEKIVGVIEALQENLGDSHTKHTAINQQLEVIRWQTYNYLQQWVKEEVADSVEINLQLQETLEELQIAEEELRQQNEQLIYSREITEAERQRYQNLFEFAPNGYLVTDSLGIIQQANYAAASLLSVGQNHLIGKPLLVFVVEKHRFQFVAQLKKIQHLQEWEIDFQPRQGSLFSASVRVNPISDSEGKRTGLLWSITDISEQQAALRERKKLEAALRQNSDVLETRVKERMAELVIANERLQQEIVEREQIQKSLQESEARLTLALEAGKIGIWDWHIQINKTLWSVNLGLMYGLPINILSPDCEDFLKLIYPEDREQFQKCVSASIEKKVDFVCEYRIVASDGSLNWLSSRGKVYCNENGEPIRMIGTTRDISERKATEQQLYEQAALLDIANDAIFVRDFQAQILFWNQGAEKIYGWKRQEILDKNPKDIFYDSTSHEQEIIPLKTVVRLGSWQGELRKRTQSNQLIIVQSRWTLMLDGDGQPKSILTVDTDITERKRLEDQFSRAQQMEIHAKRMESIGTLAGGIAHNINNHLTPILGYAQLLRSKSSLDKDNCLPMLITIENNAKKGAALVRQLLSFAKGVEIQYTIIQIGDLIRDTIQMAKETFSFPQSIRFLTDLPPKLWTVSGDKNELEQVLINLMINAGHAMPNGGNLSISAENLYISEEIRRINHYACVGNYIVITVEDTGTGMPPEILERIFEPFFTTKDIGKGTGLGLSTSLGTIKSHKGFINVDSEVGKGSKFKVFLPSVNQEVIPLEPDYRETYPGRRELILVVDDEPQVLEVTKNILESYNYQTITAKNGMEAIAIYARYKQQIRAVLMDMMMPEMDGSSAISNLKKINPQVKIIACSGRNIQNMLESSNENQVPAILLKPYTNQELLETLSYVLKESGVRSQEEGRKKKEE